MTDKRDIIEYAGYLIDEVMEVDYPHELRLTKQTRISEPPDANSSSPDFHGILMRIRIGGMSGGNCWGGVAKPYEEIFEISPYDMDFDILDHIITEFLPETSDEIVRKANDMVTEHIRTYSEYYGNSTQFREMFLNIEDLVQFMNEHEIRHEPGM